MDGSLQEESRFRAINQHIAYFKNKRVYFGIHQPIVHLMLVLKIQILRLLFAVVLALPVLISTPAQAVEDCAAVTGAWFDPALDGEGFYLLETGSGLAITYYGYINTEQRLWLVSEVLPGPITFGTDLSIDMLVGDGGSFQQPVPSSELTLWGSLTMNFSDSGRARFLLSGTDGDKHSEVIKIAGVRRQVCNAAYCVIPTEGSGRLSFANDAVHGIFDPSLDAEVDTDAVWLSYSTVSSSLQWSPQNPLVVQTRLARSTDAGLTFSFVNEINPVLDVTPDLFSTHGATYLWVSPVSDSPFPDSYHGCRAYRFTNLADGSLQTNAGGRPTPVLALDGLPKSFNGACALHAAADDRSFYSQLMTSSPEKFQVFRASSDHCLSQ